MKTLYIFIDESGQDTKGGLFLVVVAIIGDKNLIESELQKIENVLGTSQKWHKTMHSKRVNYIELILGKTIFKNKIFVTHFPESGKAYVDLTIFATAKAIKYSIPNDNNRLIITIDGLRKNEVNRFRAGLRKLGMANMKVRGGREESNELLRLTDMIAGLARDYFEKRPYASELFKELIKKNIVALI